MSFVPLHSHTSWKVYTETLSNFEGKFCNTIRSCSFVWNYTKYSNYGAVHESQVFLYIPVAQETTEVNLYQQEMMSPLNPAQRYLLANAS